MIVMLRVPDFIDDEASDLELEAICEHIAERLRLGVDGELVFQSLLEAVLSFDVEDMDVTHHVIQ